MDIKKLRQALADAKAKGAKALAALNALTGLEARTEEQEAQLTALEASVDASVVEVEAAAEALAKAEKDLKRATMFAPLAAGASAIALATSMPAYGATSVNMADPEQTHNFANIADFAKSVHAADTGGAVDERLSFRAANPQNPHIERGGDAGEGHLVPAAFAANIWEGVFSEFDFMTAADTEPTNSNHVKLLADQSTPWGATGITAGYRKEIAQMLANKTTLDPVGVDVFNLYAFVEASDELLSDAPRLASRLTNKAAQAIRYRGSESVFAGSGAGEPLGFTKSGAMVVVAKEVDQTLKLVPENVAKMFSRILPSSIGRSAWYMNSDLLPAMMVMKIGDVPIWTPPVTGFNNAPGGFLLGRPIQLNDHSETAGALGDIVLADMKGYYHALRQQIEFAQSMHLYFDRGANAFRWTFRHGGKPYLSKPVSPAKGTATKSHFVGLAAR